MPNNNAVLTDLGVYYYRKGKYEEAIKFFLLLANQTPNNSIAYLNISACHYLQGDIEEAIFAAEKSLEIEPSADGYANIGTYNFLLKKYDLSVLAYEKMMMLNDTDYINWGNLADSYYFSNSVKYVAAFKQAINLAEQAIEINKSDKYAIASLAYYYANLSNVKKTKHYASQITRKDAGEDQFFVAAAYARLNMRQTALQYLEFAINNNYSIAEIKTSPLMEVLKDDPKYLSLILGYED